MESLFMLFALPHGISKMLYEIAQTPAENGRRPFERISDYFTVINGSGLDTLCDEGAAVRSRTAPVNVCGAKPAIHICRRVFERADIHE
jgi:hypothetical protein